MQGRSPASTPRGSEPITLDPAGPGAAVRKARRGRLRVAALIALLAFGMAAAGCRAKQPRKHLPYTVLNNAFQPLRKDFEAESDKVRLVALVTPSCGDCMANMQDVNVQLLSRIKSPDFVVFAIWTSIVPPDVAPRAAQAAEMFPDPRIHHYWDDSGRIARAFGQQLGVDPGLSVNDIFYLYARDDTWDPNGTMTAEPPDQNALMAGWMPTPPRYRMGHHKLVKMPEFDVNLLTREADELLALPAASVAR